MEVVEIQCMETIITITEGQLVSLPLCDNMKAPNACPVVDGLRGRRMHRGKGMWSHCRYTRVKMQKGPEEQILALIQDNSVPD